MLEHNEIARVVVGLGMDSPGDLLRWVPKTYRDYRHPSGSIRDAHGKGKSTLVLQVIGRREFSRDGQPMGAYREQRPYRLSLRFRDANGVEAWGTVFGALFPWAEIKVGHNIAIYAEVEEWNGALQIRSPELVPYTQVGQMVAVYRGKRGRVGADAVSAAIAHVLNTDIGAAQESMERQIGLPGTEIVQQAGLRFKTLGALFEAIHRPQNPAEAYLASNDARMLSVFHIKRMARLVKERPASVDSCINIPSEKLAELIACLPYELTQDQAISISEICRDLASETPMRRLLSGDVGTGKTATYLVPAVAALQQGAVVMVLAPSILLARQLVNEAQEFFPFIKVSLIIGRGAKKDLSKGALIIGTTAMINSAKKAGVVPDLLVCDEQQRLSTAQREALVAAHTNILEASATAIPRTIALATHGGMDVSFLRQSPVEKSIITRLVSVSDRDKLMDYLERIVAKGGQIAVVYPRVDAAEEASARGSVESAFRHWERRHPGMAAMLHGKLKDDEKITIMDDFKSGKKRILVASVLIETGLTIKGLRGLMVVDPDRLGTSQLHQLRGRLARLGGIGYMFLYSSRPLEDLEEETLARLQLVEAVNDGFELAERDAYARGFGDVSGEGETQDGKMALLFHGVKITPKELDC